MGKEKAELVVDGHFGTLNLRGKRDENLEASCLSTTVHDEYKSKKKEKRHEPCSPKKG